MEKKKLLYIECLRIIACICVLYLHSWANMLFMEYDIHSIRFWAYQFLSVSSRCGVPVFFMISGAMLIGKNEGVRSIWKNRIFKTAVILIVFSLLAYIGSAVTDHEFSIAVFLRKLYGSYTNVAYWYLYAYIAFLMSLPFLKAICRNITDRHFCYMIFLAFVLYEVRRVAEYLLFNGQLTVNSNLVPNWMFANIVLYPCIGYFLSVRFDVLKFRKKLPLLWILNIICIILCCMLSAGYLKTAADPDTSRIVTFHKAFEMVSSITVFISVKLYFETHSLNKKTEKRVLFFGHYTLGIYLIHMFIVKLIGLSPLRNILNSLLGNMKMIASLTEILIVLIISLILTVAGEILWKQFFRMPKYSQLSKISKDKKYKKW